MVRAPNSTALPRRAPQSQSPSSKPPGAKAFKVLGDLTVPLPPPPPLRHPMPRLLHRYEIKLLCGVLLPKSGEDRKHAEVWLQPETPGVCPLNKRGPAYVPSIDDPINPFVVVRLFGGRFAGVGPEDKEVEHGSLWASRRIENNGLRPRWNETFVVYASQPDLAVLHFEVRPAREARVTRCRIPTADLRQRSGATWPSPSRRIAGADWKSDTGLLRGAPAPRNADGPLCDGVA